MLNTKSYVEMQICTIKFPWCQTCDSSAIGDPKLTEKSCWIITFKRIKTETNTEDLILNSDQISSKTEIY